MQLPMGLDLTADRRDLPRVLGRQLALLPLQLLNSKPNMLCSCFAASQLAFVRSTKGQRTDSRSRCPGLRCLRQERHCLASPAAIPAGSTRPFARGGPGSHGLCSSDCTGLVLPRTLLQAPVPVPLHSLGLASAALAVLSS